MKPQNSKHLRVKIEQGKPLPSICISCGNQSETLLFKKKTQKRGADWIFHLFFGNLFSYLFFGSTDRPKVKVALPICFSCKKVHENLQPKKVDYAEFYMEFEVHPKFKEELEKFNKSRYNRYYRIF